MSLREIDNFYLQQPEPAKSCLLALREIILQQDPDLRPEWKYKLPFYYYKGKMFCYCWIQKTNGWPYIGFTDGYLLDHPDLVAGNRRRMKILLINPEKDLPVRKIKQLLKQALALRT